jgi:hypothetical protein
MAALAHWDALATFDKLTAVLEQQQQQQQQAGGSAGSTAGGGMLAAWTSGTYRADGKWWWMSTGQPANYGAMRWAAGYPSDSTAARPYLMAVQEGPARWAVANVAAGGMAYPLCRVAGARRPGGSLAGLLRWRCCCGSRTRNDRNDAAAAPPWQAWPRTRSTPAAAHSSRRRRGPAPSPRSSRSSL